MLEWCAEWRWRVKVEDTAGKSTRRAGWPDVIASNNEETVFLKVETKDSIEKDKDQQETFEDYADKHKNVRFRRKTV